MFIVDSSGSVLDEDWDLLRGFVADIVLNVGVSPDGVHVGIVDFRYPLLSN